LIKLRKLKKNNQKTKQKKLIKLIKILKKPAGLIWFRFYKQKQKKPNRTETEKNRAKLEKPSQTGLLRFLP